MSTQLAALDGARIPGGCDHCDAYQVVRAYANGSRVHVIRVYHDDDCPVAALWSAEWGSAVSGPVRATPAQVAAVNNQFWYLGYRRADRAERLAACAALLGLDGLSSTKDLTAGQAGQLVRLLAQLRARGELDAAIAATGRASGKPLVVDSGVLAAAVIFALCSGAWQPRPHGGPVSPPERKHQLHERAAG